LRESLAAQAEPDTSRPATPSQSPAVPLAWRNPVTGPGRPPLPEDGDGPFGSTRNTGTSEVALTFDDGPDPQWTPQVLQLLKQYKVKATFCLIGANAEQFPHLVRAIAADGHSLCNHTWLHDLELGEKSRSVILADMQRTNDAIHAAAPHARVSYFRHPGGNWTEAAVSAAKSLGMTSLHWDVDPKDWLKPGARAIAAAVNSSAVPGAIVLLHDGGGDRRGTVEALRSILPHLTARLPLVALPAGIDPPRKHGRQLPVHLGQQ
jgi:peptidoglycan/xylan/chitin deacetylase (PgdA/CDA1 family)